MTLSDLQGRSPVASLLKCNFRATVCKTVRPMLSDHCPGCLSETLVHCGQTVGRIKMKLGTEVGLGPGHIVLDGDLTPLPQRGTAPNEHVSMHNVCKLQ